MKKTPNIESIDRTLSRTREWLVGLARQMDSDDSDDVSTTLRAVLHALRDRLPLIASVRLGAQLPTLLRGVYYEGWQPDRGNVHTRSLGEFLNLVERYTPHGSEVAPEDKVKAVFRLLSAELDAAELNRVFAALPAPVQELFPRPLASASASASASERSVVRLSVPTAKTA